MKEWTAPTIETIALQELDSLADLEVAFTSTCCGCTCDATF